MATLPELLKTLVEVGGSDLHLTTQTPPQIRVHGKLQVLDLPPLGPADTKSLAYSVLTDTQKKRFEETLELDFSFGIRGLARFRCNVFNQRGAVAAVYRVIPEQIKSFAELSLPPVIATLADRPRGLVLVTGPTGSGKSTTLAAMIDKINAERREHILTIEDPIEYIHQHKGCLVNQREVHSDTHGFAGALRSALREDPDIVLIGELRDLETIESALRIAETPAIRNLIRDDKVHQIYSTMQTGQEKFGMQTMNQSLATLYHKRMITLEYAMSASSQKDELEQMISRGAGVVQGAGMGQRPGGPPRPGVR
jgi:twitching motility protein PilT